MIGWRCPKSILTKASILLLKTIHSNLKLHFFTPPQPIFFLTLILPLILDQAHLLTSFVVEANHEIFLSSFTKQTESWSVGGFGNPAIIAKE